MSAADLNHHATILSDELFGRWMLFRFRSKSAQENIADVLIAAAFANRAPHVELERRMQARHDHSFGGQPQTRARIAERLRHRCDDADAARMPATGYAIDDVEIAADR